MADSKISALAELAEPPAATDELVLVDKSDTSMAGTGTDKRIQGSNLGYGAWTSFSVTWTNLTEGNGVETAYYKQIGKTVHFYVHFVFGSTSSMDGNPSISLPVTAANWAKTNIPLGIAQMLDSGVTVYAGTINWGSTTTAVFRVSDASGTYLANKTTISSSVPMTWATDDEITCSGIYEAA